MVRLGRFCAVRPRGLRYRIYPDYGYAPLYGGWEPSLQRLLTRLVPVGSVVYDVGANFGIHTLLFSRLVGEQGHVYAFEPVPDIAEELDRNLRLNKIANVTIVRQALSDHVGMAAFDRGPHAGAGHLSTTTGGDLMVELTTLDRFALQPGHSPPNLLKIDAEGAESKVLAGGLGVLAERAPHVLVETHNFEEERSVGAILLENGYDGPPTTRGRTGRPVEEAFVA